MFFLSGIVSAETYSTRNPYITSSPEGSVNYSTRDMNSSSTSSVKKNIDDLTEDDCKHLIINAKTDNTVEYKAGVDAKGNKVASADLPGSPATKDYNLGNDVHIGLQGKLKEYAPPFPPPAPGNKDFIDPVLRDSDAHIGNIDVHKDGKIWINGVPAFDEEQTKLEEACRKKFPNL